jgi:hypothetical protein
VDCQTPRKPSRCRYTYAESAKLAR